jgi:hypothetical protein
MTGWKRALTTSPQGSVGDLVGGLGPANVAPVERAALGHAQQPNPLAIGSGRRKAVTMPAETAYHELGDHFAKNADTSPYNAYTDRPAMLALAGDVAGLRILD